MPGSTSLPRLAAFLAAAAFCDPTSPGAWAQSPAPAPPVAINPDGWPVHDPNRPTPPKVEPRPAEPLDALSKPPQDAIVLFDGSSLDAWQAPAWRIVEESLEVVPKAGTLATKQAFGSCYLHLQWSSPLPVIGHGQGRGNSGVFLMGRYEIQVLDNYDNPTYADGMAGSAYGQSPPLANPLRPPGEWNTLQILFRAPRFSEDGSLLRTAAATVLLNGIPVLNNFEFFGISTWKKRAVYAPHPPKAPLHLQDHGDRVRFRNIWIVPLED